MEKRRPKLGGWCGALLSIALLALAFQTGGTTVAAEAGAFPAFIQMPDVTPRGVAVDKVGNVFVSASVGSGNSEHIWVWKFSPAGEEMGPPVDIGQGTIGGLMVKANGDLSIALAAGQGGVYRMDRRADRAPPAPIDLRTASLMRSMHAHITESHADSHTEKKFADRAASGIVRGAEADVWMRDEVLRGTGALGQPVWFGANGIAYDHGNLHVTNTEKGTVMRIPVLEDGSAGVPEVWALQPVPESPVPYPPMGDGIALDVHGNLYVAVLTKSAVVRINAGDLSQETVAVFPFVPDGSVPHALLDFPASLFFGTGKGERTNIFVTNLGWGWAGPSLVKIDAGVPGLPLQ
jgi:sugar lactone lactonase YvrE